MKKSKSSTRKLINLKSINENSIVGYNKIHEIYFSVAPFNLSVLSEKNIEIKIEGLTNILKSIDGVELFCMNSIENYDSNKEYYKGRIKEESNQVINEILNSDIDMLDRINVDTAKTRKFLICLKYSEKELEIGSLINMLSKTLMSSGFSCDFLDRRQILDILTFYFV